MVFLSFCFYYFKFQFWYHGSHTSLGQLSQNPINEGEEDIVTYKSTLTNKEQEIRELQMELENCYYAIEENHLGLLIFKSELVEAYSNR